MGNPSTMCFWKFRRCLALIPLLCCLKVSWNPWNCGQSYIFLCEESRTSTEEWLLLWSRTGRIGKLMGKAVRCCYYGNADFASLLAHSCQLSGFQHTRWIWTPMCCLCCSHWQYFALNRVKSYQGTSFQANLKAEESEVCAINLLEFSKQNSK